MAQKTKTFRYYETPTIKAHPATRRPQSQDRGYDWTWNKKSRAYRAQHPICECCDERVSEMVHHIQPLDQGGERLADQNLKALCQRCHMKVESQYSRVGWRRAAELLGW